MQKEISKSVLKRLPGYLAYLKNLPDDGNTHISATALANALNMGEVQVRKDLAMVSDGGRPKVGYLRQQLIEDISQFLMGIVTVPAAHAQEVCDRLIANGIKAVWNFAPIHLDVPEHILVQNENMATSLAVLSMHLQAQIKEKK